MIAGPLQPTTEVVDLLKPQQHTLRAPALVKPQDDITDGVLKVNFHNQCVARVLFGCSHTAVYA